MEPSNSPVIHRDHATVTYHGRKGGRWRVCVRVNGKRVYRSRRTREEAFAVRDALLDGTPEPPGGQWRRTRMVDGKTYRHIYPERDNTRFQVNVQINGKRYRQWYKTMEEAEVARDQLLELRRQQQGQ